MAAPSLISRLHTSNAARNLSQPPRDVLKTRSNNQSSSPRPLLLNNDEGAIYVHRHRNQRRLLRTRQPAVGRTFRRWTAADGGLRGDRRRPATGRAQGTGGAAPLRGG